MNTDSSLSPTNKDSTLMNTSSNLNTMIETKTSHHEQYESTNDDLSLASNDTSSSVNNMISSLRFSKSVTKSMLDYEYPWMRLEIDSEPKRTRTNFTHHQRLELEKEFHYSKYATRRRQIEISRRLLLTKLQIKSWFQSRRCRWKHSRCKSPIF